MAGRSCVYNPSEAYIYYTLTPNDRQIESMISNDGYSDKHWNRVRCEIVIVRDVDQCRVSSTQSHAGRVNGELTRCASIGGSGATDCAADREPRRALTQRP